ncbi:DUF2892 domain-containing protein [Sulfurospirillum sp. T05]|uniref:DUF2892 domain-containing protein n=1 Tax=Sulfurospirillum tamanense TaxID=2813362 RepID=A0ABS2WV08_9BACT|nr:DUF2892 domain-containing protein [Sulfurospirillum tamanensis]MBN2965482.1 DUF2892 domain-containing protein [Sulfurospirillum tamanensis]
MCPFKANVGGIDRIARIVIGGLIIAWALWAQSWLGVIGVVVLLTGVFRFCGAYTLFKFSTTNEDSDSCSTGKGSCCK